MPSTQSRTQRGTLMTDHLPSGSSDGRELNNEPLARVTPRPKGGLDGSPAGNGQLDTFRFGAGEPPVFKPAAGSESPRSGRVQNTADNFSALPDFKSASKWNLMDFLRLESVRPRQRACQAKPTGDRVSVRHSKAWGAGFSGLQSCGSVTCPHCGGKIAASRRDEINRAVTNWRAVDGQEVLFGTLTLRHHGGQSFDFLMDAAAGCWTAATDGRQWAKDRASHGIAGYLRVWETKWSDLNGWHVHVHFLLFLNAPTAAHAAIEPDIAISALLARIFARWSRAAERLGLRAPLLRAQDLHRVTGDDSDVLGVYLAKQMTDDSKPAGDMAWELAPGAGKTRGESLTPRQLLDAAAAGNSDRLGRWNEYELGMHGRRTIAWSKGLRDLVGLDEQKTDEQIAAEEVGTQEDTVVTMLKGQWRTVAKTPGMRAGLLHTVETFGGPVAVDWLAVRGVHAWLDERESR